MTVAGHRRLDSPDRHDAGGHDDGVESRSARHRMGLRRLSARIDRLDGRRDHDRAEQSAVGQRLSRDRQHRWHLALAGRIARLDDGARRATRRSESKRDTIRVFPIASLIEQPVRDPSGTPIGRSIGAMVRDDGVIAYFVVAKGGLGGIGERLHSIARADVTVRDAELILSHDSETLAALPTIDPTNWPSRAPRDQASDGMDPTPFIAGYRVVPEETS